MQRMQGSGQPTVAILEEKSLDSGLKDGTHAVLKSK